MYTVQITNTRWYDVRLKDGRVLHLEPPSLATLRKIEQLDGSVDTLAETTAAILSKNKKGTKVTPDEVCRTMTFEECDGLLTAYMQWVNGERESDPN